MIWVSEVSKESHINMPMLRFLFIYLIIYSFFFYFLSGGGGKIRPPLHKILHPPQLAVITCIKDGSCCGRLSFLAMSLHVYVFNDQSVTFIHFYIRCGPCRNIAPVYEQLAAKYPNAVFLKVDVDKCRVTDY